MPMLTNISHGLDIILTGLFRFSVLKKLVAELFGAAAVCLPPVRWPQSDELPDG
jgi:hypothetical protein